MYSYTKERKRKRNIALSRGTTESVNTDILFYLLSDQVLIKMVGLISIDNNYFLPLCCSSKFRFLRGHAHKYMLT